MWITDTFDPGMAFAHFQDSIVKYPEPDQYPAFRDALVGGLSSGLHTVPVGLQAEVADFVRLMDIFDGFVFKGFGKDAGLTSFCGALCEYLAVKFAVDDKTALTNWRCRIMHLQLMLCQRGVPNLPALSAVSTWLNTHTTLAKILSSQWAAHRKEALDGLNARSVALRESAKDLAKKIADAVREGERMLVVGSSSALTHALESLTLKQTGPSGVYAYCPGPAELLEGRNANNCAACGLRKGVGTVECVKREKAISLIRTNGIHSIWAVACAFTEDRAFTWVTRGAKEIAIEACDKGLVMNVIGGAHKKLRKDPSTQTTLRAVSRLVDSLPERQPSHHRALYQNSFLA